MEVVAVTAPTSDATQQDSGRERNEDDLRAPWGLIRTVLAAMYYAVRVLIEIHR
jgi:hypothetical protein